MSKPSLRLKKITSWILAFSMFTSIFSPLGNITFATPTPTFVAAETVANVPHADATTASRTDAIIINNLPTAGDSITIGGTGYTFRDMSFFTSPRVENEVLIDPGMDVAATASYLIDAINGVTCSPAEEAQDGNEICTGTIPDPVVIATEGTATNKITLTANMVGEGGNVTISTTNPGAITIVSPLTGGADEVTAVPQEIDFTPENITNRLVLNAEINGTTYRYSTHEGETIQQAVEALQPNIDANTAVNCTENDIKITCAATNTGTALASFSGYVVDKNALFDAINNEYTDGASRTAYVLTETEYTDNSWLNYINAIDGAKATESLETSSQADVDLAIANIATAKATLELDGFIHSYNITSNALNDADLDVASYSGFVHVVYTRDGNIYYKNGIGQEELVGPGATPQIAVGSGGLVQVAYIRDQNVVYNFKTSSWNNEMLVASGISVDIDVDTNGTPHFIYLNNNQYSDVIYAYKNNNTFVQSIKYDGFYDDYGGGFADADYYNYPRIKMDSSGNYHITVDRHEMNKTPGWIDHDYRMIYLSNRSGGVSYSSPSAGNSGWLGGYKNGLALNASGVPYLIYRWSDGNAKLVNLSAGWNETTLGTGIGNPAMVIEGTRMGVAYNNGLDEIRYMENTGNGFAGSTMLDTNTSYPGLAIMNGEKYVYYVKSDGSDDELKAATTDALYAIAGSFFTADDIFVSLTGSIDVSNLDVGGVYTLMSGSTVVSSGALVASSSTGQISLNPMYFQNFGHYTLTLSGTNNGQTNSNLDTLSIYSGPINYETLYTTIGGLLEAQGIYNNFAYITNSGVQAFSDLYFEAHSGSQILGRIAFIQPLDLTDSGTIALLQDLPNAFSMENGHISFNPGSNPILNTGATLQMYFTGSEVPTLNMENAADYITARDLNGDPVPDALSGSLLTCAVGVGIPYQICTFTSNHFTSFDFNPYLSIVRLDSNNIYSTDVIKTGERARVRFLPSETLTGVTVTFNGIPAESVTPGVGFWSAISQPFGSGASGSVAFTIDYFDLNGNAGAQVTATTDASEVTVDNAAPTAVIAYSTTGSTRDNVVATLTGASEDIIVTNNEGELTYVFTDNGSFTFEFRDMAGNTGATTATVANIDRNFPTASVVYSTTGATNQDVVATLTGASREITVTNNGGLFTYTFSTNGSFTFEFEDTLGNTGATTATVANIDKVAPTASVTYSTTDPTNQNVVATLTGASEDIVVTNNSGALTHTLTDNGSFTFEFRDAAGNTGATTATVANIDRVAPTVTVKHGDGTTDYQLPAYAGASEGVTFGETLPANTLTFSKTLSAAGKLAVQNALQAGTNQVLNFRWGGGTGPASRRVFVYLTGAETAVWQNDVTATVTDLAGNSATLLIVDSAPVVLGGGTLTETGSTTLTGSVGTGETFDMSGTSLTIDSNPLNPESVTGSLTISGTNIVVSGSGAWNGVLIPPTLVDSGSSNAATGSEIGSGITVVQTVQAGASGASLQPTGTGYFTISFMIPGYASGTTFKLFRSADGNTWVPVSPDATCTLDANSMCTFRTDHLSFFAPAFDSTPDAFSFTAQTDKELSTAYESNTITVAGINTGSTVTISGGQYKIGAGSYTSSAGTVLNGETITVKLTSSSAYSTLATATLTIGGVSANFNVTTKAQPASSGGSSGGGGGGSTISIRDNCPNGDKTPSYYDGKCELAVATAATGTTTAHTNSGITQDYVPQDDGNDDTDNTTQQDDASLPFPDISRSFALNYILKLVNRGVVHGFDDGTFGPDKAVTRAEFLSMVMKNASVSVDDEAVTDFTDIPSGGTWMVKYLAKAKTLGIITGQTVNGKLVFRPNDSITRAEAIAILFRTYGIGVDATATTDFVDVPTVGGEWMTPYIAKAKELGIINGQEIDGKLMFRPNDSITRAEAAKVIVRTGELQ